MSQSTVEIVRQLPYLRRYARALFGSQDWGDQYVRICLEALLADSTQLPDTGNIRVSLFTFFNRVQTHIAESIGFGVMSARGGHAFSENIVDMPPTKWQVLLLTALEGFSVDEVAMILEIGPADVTAIREAAYVDLETQTATRALVIEDEPIIAVDIAGIMKDMGHQVIGTAATKAEALDIATRRRPGIILADIKLGDDSSGIDAVGEILDAVDVPAVFVTAYPERLLTGEAREPAYLVTKPFEPNALKVTVYQALLVHQQQAIRAEA